MSPPRATVGVLIAVRDGAEFLGEALTSLRGQTQPPDEIVVVDDGSTDGTRAIAEAYSGVVVFEQEPRGQGAALNHALRQTQAEYVGFLDADDLWTPSKLARQGGVLAARPDVDAVFGAVEQFRDPNLGSRRLAFARSPEPSHLLGAALVRRSFLERVGPLREDLPVAAAIDWYARWRAFGLREHMLLDVVLRRRLHRENVGRSLRQPDGYFAALRAHLVRRSPAPPEDDPC